MDIAASPTLHPVKRPTIRFCATDSAMNCTILETENLGKTYNGARTPVEAVRNIDLTIRRGDFTVVMGSSGSGKSTLLYLLSGLEQLTHGTITFEDQRIDGLSQKKLALLRRRGMGFVFQAMHLVPNLTLLENIVVPGSLADQNHQRLERRAMELLDLLEIGRLAHRLPSQLSGGEQQRGALARALINSPTMLFADEPTGALNSSAGQILLDCLSAIHQRGQAVLMVTHDLTAACRGNRVLYMRDGQIVGEKRLDGDDTPTRDAREQALYGWLTQMGW